MKKRILLFVFLLGIMTVTCFAQDNCKMCGDWVGTVWKSYPHNTKSDGSADWQMGKMIQYIRIKRFGDEYKIRLKHQYVDGDIGTVYNNDEITILNATDTSIYYKTIDYMSCNYDQYDRITDCSRVEKFFIITYHNGYIHQNLTAVQALRYDSNKQYVGTTRENLSSWLETFPEYNLDLYKEENDW